jgi:glycosyltransferase involved in cell wall biosynthesis
MPATNSSAGPEDILIAGYRWLLPLGPESVDYGNLEAWGARSSSLLVLVRGSTLRGKRQQVHPRVTVRSSPGGGVPGLGVACFVVWVTYRYIMHRPNGPVRVHASDPLGSAIAALATRLRRPGSLVVHVQGPYFDPPRILGWRGRVHSVLERSGSRRATVVRLVSSDAIPSAIRSGIPEERLAVVWSRADVRSFAEGPIAGSGSPKLLYCGSLVRRKGLHDLLSALAAMPADARPHLTIAGDGPERKALENRCRQEGIDVDFPGAVPHDQLPELMRRHSIFVLPSLSDSTPRAVMEAMAAGSAVVTSDVGDLPTMVSDAGVVFSRGNIGALRAAIARVAQHDELRERLGREARLRALEKFDLHRNLDALLELGRPERKRRVVFVLPALDLAGDEHFVHSIVMAEAVAARADADVDILALRPAAQPWAGSGEVRVQYLSGSRVRRTHQLTKRFMNLRSGDTVYVRISTGATILAVAIARVRGFRVALWHSTWAPGMPRSRDSIDRRLRWLIPRVDVLVTFPETLAKFYQERYGARSVSLVPNNVMLSQLSERPWPTPEGRRLLFIGRVSPRKGAEDLPAIVGALRRLTGDRDSLVVVGQGPSLAAIRSSTGILALGPLPNGEALGLLSQANLFIAPSYAEGCSRAMQEACALGIPFVAYDIPPVIELLGDLALRLCVPSGDVESAAVRALELLDLTEEQRSELTTEMRTKAGEWQAERLAPQLIAALLG